MDKIKVLFLAANPSGTNPLKLDEEIRSITEKIRASEHRDSLSLVSVWAVRPDDLLQSLNEHKPQVVHFSGHGSSTGEIILTDNNGNPKPVSETALRALFKTLKGNIRVVILNACYSKNQAQAIAEFIDCVIGMNTAIGDQAAITFAGSFYRAIGFGRSVQEAYEQGKVALMLEGIPEATTPDLLCGPSVDPARVFPFTQALRQSESIADTAQLPKSPPVATSASQQIEFLLDNGEKIVCEPEPFAAGGEGKLYWSSNGKSVVKIYYHPNSHLELILRTLLGKYNVVAGDSEWEELFAWPQALVKQPSLGVVLPRLQQYDLKEISWYLSSRGRELLKKLSPDKLGNWENYLAIAIKMARIIERLEQFRLIHLDLSPTTFLVDPPKERIVLINVDALMIPGFTSPQMLTTASCMAPELITQTTLLGKEIAPSQITVRHTLAVLIYWLLFQRHPLIGPKRHSPDPEIDEARTLGDRALFIEHPTDSSNRPGNLIMPYTSMLTPPVQRLVERAFINGIHVPEKRPTATEWVNCLSDMKASLSSFVIYL